MKHDCDDTITLAERPVVQPTEPDLDDTIIRSTRRRLATVQPYSAQAANPRQTSGQRPSRQSRQVSAKQSGPSSTITAHGPETSALYYRVQLDGSASAHNLEHPCVFGRDPRPPRVVRGVGPRLVAVKSPNREVSETHVEIRQLGSSVIVTDLRSTNGSLVQVPGNAARKLRQGESVVVSAGTLVDIGDGNIIRILPRRRLE